MNEVPWHVVRARLMKTLELDKAKLESPTATLEELRVAQGRISICKELLQIEKSVGEKSPSY